MSEQITKVFERAAQSGSEVDVLLTVIYGQPRVYKTSAYKIGAGTMADFPNRHEDCDPQTMGAIAHAHGYTVYNGPWRRAGTYQHGWHFGPITSETPERAMPVDQVEDEALSRRMEKRFALAQNQARIVNKRDGNHPAAIYVGRPTYWGNPFSHLTNLAGVIHVDTREDAVELHRMHLAGEIEIPELNKQRLQVIGNLLSLRNRQLECWCAPEACHAENLATWADSRPPIRVLVTTSSGIDAKLNQAMAAKAGDEIEILALLPSGAKDTDCITRTWAAAKGSFHTPIWLPHGNPEQVYAYVASTLAPYVTHVIADSTPLGQALTAMAYHTEKPYRNY